MKRMKRMICVVCLLLALSACSSGNLQETKDNAPAVLERLGFTVVGYEGYSWGFLGLNTFGGAHVWYTLTRESTGGKVTYSGAVQRWGDEYHNTYIRAIDAISTK